MSKYWKFNHATIHSAYSAITRISELNSELHDIVLRHNSTTAHYNRSNRRSDYVYLRIFSTYDSLGKSSENIDCMGHVISLRYFYVFTSSRLRTTVNSLPCGWSPYHKESPSGRPTRAPFEWYKKYRIRWNGGAGSAVSGVQRFLWRVRLSGSDLSRRILRLKVDIEV